jgi:hypothetical protein
VEDVKVVVEQIWHLLPPAYQNFSVVVARPSIGGEMRCTAYETSTSWKDTQCEMFLLISDIIMNAPDKALKSRPEVWMDARFRNLEAIFPATNTTKKKVISSSCAHLGEAITYPLALENINNLSCIIQEDEESGDLYFCVMADLSSGQFFWLRINHESKDLIGMWARLRRNTQ